MSLLFTWTRSIALGAPLLAAGSLTWAESPTAASPAASAASVAADDSEAKLSQVMSSLGLTRPVEISETARVLAEGGLISMKGGMRQLAKDGLFPPAQAACAQALPKEALYPAFQAQLNMKLRADQVEEADRFYRSSAGRKLAQEVDRRALMDMGETVSEPAPVLTPDERAELERFINSDVGRLLIKDRVLFTPEALMIYGTRVDALLKDCAEKAVIAP